MHAVDMVCAACDAQLDEPCDSTRRGSMIGRFHTVRVVAAMKAERARNLLARRRSGK